MDATLTKLLCYRKADGKWSDATELVTESTPIVAFTAQMYAPDDFVPVAYMCAEEEQKVQKKLKSAKKSSEARAVLRIKPWVKLLKAPVHC